MTFYKCFNTWEDRVIHRPTNRSRRANQFRPRKLNRKKMINKKFKRKQIVSKQIKRSLPKKALKRLQKTRISFQRMNRTKKIWLSNYQKSKLFSFNWIISSKILSIVKWTFDLVWNVNWIWKNFTRKLHSIKFITFDLLIFYLDYYI